MDLRWSKIESCDLFFQNCNFIAAKLQIICRRVPIPENAPRVPKAFPQKAKFVPNLQSCFFWVTFGSLCPACCMVFLYNPTPQQRTFLFLCSREFWQEWAFFSRPFPGLCIEGGNHFRKLLSDSGASINFLGQIAAAAHFLPIFCRKRENFADSFPCSRRTSFLARDL